MLIISRRKDQKIMVADEIEITILEIGRNRVRFGIKAPKRIPIQTHLKESPAPADVAQPAEPQTQKPTSPIQGQPAAVAVAKHR